MPCCLGFCVFGFSFFLVLGIFWGLCFFGFSGFGFLAPCPATHWVFFARVALYAIIIIISLARCSRNS